MSSENLDSDTQVDYEDEKQDSQEKNANPVKAEEAKLKAKYPGLGQKPGGSDFLMKRLQKGQGKAHKGIVLSLSHFSSTYTYCICYRELPPLEIVESHSGKSLTRSRSR
ncbi:endosulfine alpha b isoform X2 [Cottoperca gobio]|uniref:Alpha-endosulfine isoform X2 n=1 Tax=Cottoperca gobio TaxID=56716 RepID=A0A6J2RA64_COTGO|nr:alpha-endosulfine isoform X2 [Cottoperca gobio]XP_029307001.1 alpha-endosulfine isoform X2 [Cottoperca gobio]